MTETFSDLRTRRYRTLIDAGIEPDMAWEVAHYSAIDTLVRKTIEEAQDADNYEASNNVYGSVA